MDSKDSLENVESKWVGEIAENCQGVKLVLVALKCDLREKHADEDEAQEGTAEEGGEKKDLIDYQKGLEVARRIQALRYLGRFLFCSTNPGQLMRTRMLGKTKSRCQRSLHRSRQGSVVGEERQWFSRREQVFSVMKLQQRVLWLYGHSTMVAL